MAHTVAFNFRSGASLLHRIDPRFKIVFLAAVSTCTLGAGFVGLSVLTALFGLLARDCRLPVRAVASELRYFVFFLAIIFIARCLTEPGDPLFTAKFLSVTREGIVAGSFGAWRLALIIVMGLLFSFSTRPKEIRTGVEHLFGPVPLFPEKRVAVMIGLIVRFIPVLLNLVRETADAQRARGVEQRRNPVYHATRLVLPVMRRTVDRADQLACAMESRCFDENRPTPPLAAGPADYQAMVVVTAVCLLLLVA